MAPFVPPSGETDFFFSSVVSVLTIAGLLAVQALFALVEEAASGHNHLRSMLASAYRELTITGLISFTLFIVSAADLISDKSTALVETENVHVFVLTLAVLYLASVLLLGVLSVTLAKEWDRIELTYAADVAAYRTLKARFLELQQRLGLASSNHAEGPKAGSLTLGSVLRHPSLSREYAKALSTLMFLEQRYRFIRANSLPSDFSFGAYLRRCKQGVLRELVEVPLGAWMILLACIIGDTLLQSVQSSPTALTSSPPAQILAVSVPVLVTSLAVYAKVRSVHWNVLHNAHLSPVRMNALKARFGLAVDADGRGDDLNPRALQGLRVQAQKELFWFARPSMLLRAMQASVWGSALASALVVRYWYVFLVPQLDDSGESHGVSVSPDAWVALFAFLVGVTSLLLLRSVIPLYIVALHTGELVDWRILVEAVDKQRALEKTRRAEARLAAAAAAFEAAYGPAPLRERTARTLYHRYTLLPMLTGILASAFFSALLASTRLPSARMRYGLHVALLTLLSVLSVEILLRLYTDGGTVFFYCLTALCCRKRQAALSAHGATLRGFPPRELMWRSIMHLTDAVLTATALCIAIATFGGITEPLSRARIANWNAPEAAQLIDVTPKLYAASAIVGVRLARYVFAWRRMRPPPAAFRGFEEWQPEGQLAAEPEMLPHAAAGAASSGIARNKPAASSEAALKLMDVASRGPVAASDSASSRKLADVDSSASASSRTLPDAITVEIQGSSSGAVPPASGGAAKAGKADVGYAVGTAADAADVDARSSGNVSDRADAEVQAMARACFRGDVLRGDADVSSLAAMASARGKGRARESVPSLPYARASAAATGNVSRRTLGSTTSPGTGNDSDVFYSASTLQEGAARVLAGRLAEQLRAGDPGARSPTVAAPRAEDSTSLASHFLPDSHTREVGGAGAAPTPASPKGIGEQGEPKSSDPADDTNLSLATLTPAQRRRIRQASDLIGADLLSVLGGGDASSNLSRIANEQGAPTSLRSVFPHAFPQAEGASARRASLKSLFPGPAPTAAAPNGATAAAEGRPSAAPGFSASHAPALAAPAPMSHAQAADGTATSQAAPSAFGEASIRALIAALSTAAQAAGAAANTSAASAPSPGGHHGGAAASGASSTTSSSDSRGGGGPQLSAVAAALSTSLAHLPADVRALLRSACDAEPPSTAAMTVATSSQAGAAGNQASNLHIVIKPAAAAQPHRAFHGQVHHATSLDAEPPGARTVPATLPAVSLLGSGSDPSATAAASGIGHGIVAARLASDASMVSSADEDASDDKWAAFFARADRVLRRGGRSSTTVLQGRPAVGAAAYSARSNLERGGDRSGAGAGQGRQPHAAPGSTERPSVRSPASLPAETLASSIGYTALGRSAGMSGVSSTSHVSGHLQGRTVPGFPIEVAGSSGSSMHGGTDVTGDDGLHLALTADRSPMPDADRGEDSPAAGIAAAAEAAAAAAAGGFPLAPSSARRSSLRHIAAERLQALFARRASLIAASGTSSSAIPAVGADATEACAAAAAGSDSNDAGSGARTGAVVGICRDQAASEISHDADQAVARRTLPWLSQRAADARLGRAPSPEAARPAHLRAGQSSRTLGATSGAELAAALHRHGEPSGSDGGGGSSAAPRDSSLSNIFTVGVVSEGQRPRLRDLFLPMNRPQEDGAARSATISGMPADADAAKP